MFEATKPDPVAPISFTYDPILGMKPVAIGEVSSGVIETELANDGSSCSSINTEPIAVYRVGKVPVISNGVKTHRMERTNL
ncbi:hypothetical protein Ciccas_002298 [Cichlidogyrus casuarinus]|uniref:Uncharacterized protein n=1 Tax=Cichlidogyrus casuarinus TaxID=1844966 RepID=A0ABD2QI00_9PLAT